MADRPKDPKATANERVWCSVLSPELHAAAMKAMKRRKLTGRRAKAELIRIALATLVGDESLAEIKLGRPPKHRATTKR